MELLDRVIALSLFISKTGQIHTSVHQLLTASEKLPAGDMRGCVNVPTSEYASRRSEDMIKSGQRNLIKSPQGYQKPLSGIVAQSALLFFDYAPDL